MELNTKMFIQKTKKYLILGGVLIFSIAIGTGIFFTSLNKNIQIVAISGRNKKMNFVIKKYTSLYIMYCFSYFK